MYQLLLFRTFSARIFTYPFTQPDTRLRSFGLGYSISSLSGRFEGRF